MTIQLTEEQKKVFNRVALAKFYADQPVMHETFKRMREEAPLCWLEPEEFRPFWAVTTFSDMRTILADNETFINEPRRQLYPIALEQDIIERTGNQYGLVVRSLTDMDEPDHSVYRNVTSDWFGTKAVNELREEIRGIAAEFADLLVEKGGECDFVQDVALWYPLRVIMQLMGVPREDEAKMLKWTMELFGRDDPELNRKGKERVAGEANSAKETLADFFAYFAAITQDRQANPRDDLCTVLANATIDDKPMPTLELMSYYLIAATAGHDTTSSSSASAMLALIENPDQLQKLKENPSLFPTFINETIRWASPVRHFCRTATRDYDLNGTTIKKGETVVVFHPSANRDDSEFNDPYAFQVDRKINRHLAFGFGIHVCLGQHLARLEIGCLFEEIFKRIDNIELNGDVKWAANSFIGGLKSLPIRYTIK